MSYTKRTCHHCGKRDIQPNMRKVQIEYTSGTSQKTMSTGSVVGALLGDKRSQQQNGDSIFGTSKRKYKRKKDVWVCGDCGDTGGRRRKGTFWSLMRLFWILIKAGVKISIVLIILIVLFG